MKELKYIKWYWLIPIIGLYFYDELHKWTRAKNDFIAMYMRDNIFILINLYQVVVIFIVALILKGYYYGS